MRPAIGIVHIEIIKEGEKWTLVVSAYPLHRFAVDHIGALTDSERTTVAPGAFRILIEKPRPAELSQSTFHQAVFAALEIDSGKLPAVEGADKHIGGRMKVIFEVDEASSEAEVPGKISSVRRKCSGAITLLLQGFA